MGEPGGADGFSAVAAVDPGANPEAQLDEEPQEVSEAPAYRVDDLTFLYLTHEVYLEPYVSCRPKSWANVRMSPAGTKPTPAAPR